MAELDPERLVLPALLALLVLGSFVILITSGGSSSRQPLREAPAPRSPGASTKATRAAAPPAAPAHRFVKVQEGDTASSIAAAAGIGVDRLAELNPSVDPDELIPGQTLKLAP